MKKFKILFILINIFFINVLFIPSYILAYPVYGGDCTDQHGITKIKPLYYSNIDIDLDGIANDSFWINAKNQNKLIQIPTAPMNGGMGKVNITINVIIVLTNEYILINCEWFDNTTKPSGIKVYDGLFFCWNIDTPHFTSYYPYYFMNTSHMGGGKIDSWGATFYSGDKHENNSNFEGDDKCIQTNGWHTDKITDDVKIGFSYITDHLYSIEIKRKLSTNDQYDVQFNEEKLYLFSIGAIDDSYGFDHSISWIYALDLISNENDDKSNNYVKQKLNLGFLIMNIILIIISIFIMSFYYLSKRITKKDYLMKWKQEIFIF
jgi:hypothetical protein